MRRSKALKFKQNCVCIWRCFFSPWCSFLLTNYVFLKISQLKMLSFFKCFKSISLTIATDLLVKKYFRILVLSYPNLDCNYTFPIDLAPNFSAILQRGLWNYNPNSAQMNAIPKRFCCVWKWLHLLSVLLICSSLYRTYKHHIWHFIPALN